MERKGFGPRLLAVLIDVAVLFAVGCSVTLLAGGGMAAYTGSGGESPGVVTTGARVAAILGALIGLAYASTEIFMGATPGKMALKMKIGGETGVVPAPRDQLIRRWVIKWSPSLLNLLYALTFIRPISWAASLAGLVVLIGFFFTLGENRQALHDTLAKTAVFGMTPAVQGFQPVMPGAPTAFTPGVPPPPPPQV